MRKAQPYDFSLVLLKMASALGIYLFIVTTVLAGYTLVSGFDPFFLLALLAAPAWQGMALGHLLYLLLPAAAGSFYVALSYGLHRWKRRGTGLGSVEKEIQDFVDR